MTQTRTLSWDAGVTSGSLTCFVMMPTPWFMISKELDMCMCAFRMSGSLCHPSRTCENGHSLIWLPASRGFWQDEPILKTIPL